MPGYASGVFAKFDPATEKWTVYDLPNKDNQIPYALNVAPNGHVWICGTGNDTIHRFNPETEVLATYPLPNRVSYTREIEFDADGNVSKLEYNADKNGKAIIPGKLMGTGILTKKITVAAYSFTHSAKKDSSSKASWNLDKGIHPQPQHG